MEQDTRKQIGLYIENDLHIKLKVLAAQNQVTLSELVESILKKGCK